MGNLYDQINRRVTLKAIGLLKKELLELDSRGQSSYLCGCFLRRTHGLPCACELQGYITAGQSIPLSAIDEYWKKLDIEFPVGEFPRTSEDMVRSQDYEAVPNDTTGMSLPPVVSKAKKEKKKLGTRIPSAWESVMKAVGLKPSSSKKGRGRVSGINSSQGSGMSISQGQGRGTPSTQTTQSSPDTPTSHRVGSSSSILSRLSKSVKRRSNMTFPFVNSVFEEQFPPFIRPFIDQCTNVESDGNCGFRAIAQQIYGTQEEWVRVRRDLLDELRMRKTLFEQILGRGAAGVVALERRLSHWSGHADQSHWMTMPDCGHLIATTYNVVISTFADFLGMTCLPAYVDTNKGPPTTFVVLGNVDENSHWILLHMKNLAYPIPPISFFWPTHHDQSADDLDTPLVDRIKQYNQEYNRDAPRRKKILQQRRQQK